MNLEAASEPDRPSNASVEADELSEKPIDVPGKWSDTHEEAIGEPEGSIDTPDHQADFRGKGIVRLEEATGSPEEAIVRPVARVGRRGKSIAHGEDGFGAVTPHQVLRL